jgi:hypothetical protein
MDRVVQQNAQVVQRSVDAAARMRHEARTLAEAVSAFRLSDSGADQGARSRSSVTPSCLAQLAQQ